MSHNVVNVESPAVPGDPPPGWRFWIGRAEAEEPVPFGARWIYRIDTPDASRYWLLVTVLEPYRLLVQFNGREGQTATVRRDGTILGQLHAWDGPRDTAGVPRPEFLTHAPRVEIDGTAVITIVTAKPLEHEIRISWSDAPAGGKRVPRRESGTIAPAELAKADVVRLTGWTLNQVDFFVVDIAATRTAEWWLTSDELNRIHELAAARPPLNGRRAIGRGREWATRAEMIAVLNRRLEERGQPRIERGSGVRGLQRWATEALGIDVVRGIDPQLFTATADIVSSGEYIADARHGS